MDLARYQNYIGPRRDAGKTAAQIASELSTLYKKDCFATGSPNLTNNPDILHILAAQARVIGLESNAEWVGSLPAYMAALDLNVPENAALKLGYSMLLTQLQITGRVIFTSSDPEIAAITTALTAIVGGLVDADPNNARTSADIQASVNKATGGIIWPGCTEADIQAEFDAYDAYLTRDAAVNQINNKAGQAMSAAQSAMAQGKTPAEILADAEAAWSVS